MNIFRRIIKRIGRSVHTCQHLISTNVTGFQMVGWVRNIFYICLLILKRKGEGINLSSPIFLRITETVFDTFPYSTTVCKWKFQCFFGSMTVALPFSVPEPDMMGQEILWSVGRFGKCGNDFGSQIYINHSEQLVVFCVTWSGDGKLVSLSTRRRFFLWSYCLLGLPQYFGPIHSSCWQNGSKKNFWTPRVPSFGLFCVRWNRSFLVTLVKRLWSLEIGWLDHTS